MATKADTQWNDCFHWGFGRGFWYADPVAEVEGLTEQQLLWVPTPGSLCALWHVGHIAHRERYHIGWFLEGRRDGLVPPPLEVFGPDWASVDDVRKAVGSVDAIKDWAREVRQQSHAYIASLASEDFHAVPETSDEGNTVAQVLIQTIGHTGVHVGRIQMLRAMLEEGKERAC